MSLKYKILNSICMLAYKKEYNRFIKLCKIDGESKVRKTQLDILLKYIEENKDTEYGKKYHFSEIKTYEDYVKNVPLTVYEDYETYIDKIKSGEKNVLTKEDVMMFELTSGSSGGKKLIPYTKTLKAEFQKGIYPWLYDLNKNVKGVKDGTSYWSITPVTTKRTYTEAGIPVGFEEDAEYFGKFVQGLMNQIFAVDSKEVKFVSDMDEFYKKTSIGMLKGDRMSLISVWNPTFLTLVTDYIKSHAAELEKELGITDGSLKRDAENDDFEKVFPSLKLISCWADGNAKSQIEDIKRRFENVIIQPKGVLATECFISFPIAGEEGSRLSVNSHFFEFKSVETGEIVMADRLKPGEYEVIVTTGGGFYRYVIGDILQVLSPADCGVPRVRFLRRAGITTDICGEKMSEEFVLNVINSLGIKESFNLLTPEKDRYILYTDNKDITEEDLDRALSESFHYNYCRELGQLKRAEIVRINKDGKEIYIKRMINEGIRMGDIKPAVLSRFSGWKIWFS